MGKKTKRIELRSGSIPCTPHEANFIYAAHKNNGESVAWYTTSPNLALVQAHVHGLFAN